MAEPSVSRRAHFRQGFRAGFSTAVIDYLAATALMFGAHGFGARPGFWSCLLVVVAITLAS